MNKKLYIMFVVVIAGIGAVLSYVFLRQPKFTKVIPPNQDQVTYLDCSEGYSMSFVYSNPNQLGVKRVMTLTVTKNGSSDEYELNIGRSGSGARFESNDGKRVLWEHQGTFTYTLDDKAISTCTEK